MARFDPATLPAGQISWDPDNEGLGYRKRNDGGGGAWVVRYWVTAANGHRTRKTETLKRCPNRTQAVGVLRARQGAAFQEHYTEKRRVPTLADFAPVFLGSKSGLRSVAKYEGQLKNHLLPVFGARALDAITIESCEQYNRDRLAAGASLATATKELRCLQSLFTVARKAGIVMTNPVELVDFEPIDNERTRVTNRGELDAMLAEAMKLSRARYMPLLILVLYHGGFRISHALRLKWAEVDLSARLIRTTPDKRGRALELPIHDELHAELVRWQVLSPKSRWVFPAYRDKCKHRDRGSIVEAWKRVCSAAKVEGLVRHDLRRTLVSELDEGGASAKQIMAMTGQKTPVTVRRYVQPNAEKLRELMNARSTGDPPGEKPKTR